LRWHLHQLDASFVVPAGALDRAVWLDRTSRWLARRRPGVQVRLARELVSRCRSLTQMIVALDRELETLSAQIAPALLELPGCGGLTAAKLLAGIGPIDRFNTDAQLARHGGVAPLQASSGRTKRHRLDRGGNRQLNCALHRIASRRDTSTGPLVPTSNAKRAKAKHGAKHSAASNANSHAPSSRRSRASRY
jgi:transposase